MADVNSTEAFCLPEFRPMTKQLRRWDRQDRAQAAFNVTYWQVVEDRRLADGCRYLGVPLSPMLATKQACRKAYAEIKGKHPRAYRMRGTFFFHWDEPKDLAARQWALREIQRNVL
ncbi:hypothetical protein KDW20_24920 [Burkholderia cenocepacia]|uniref:hypothetical protein n=1 Tax=Burkholderia cenocepacia TaxID=95486 RepID=UPI001BA0B195|nr:hypothetical protein [Burkholderia cenocepacia]MBR8379015.1 hypothetical protein [Burkholderia cenocepacia]